MIGSVLFFLGGEGRMGTPKLHLVEGFVSHCSHGRHIVSKLSGIYAFADEPQTTRMLWNRVSYVPGEPRQLSIALGWPEGERPHITFVNQRGRNGGAWGSRWEQVGWKGLVVVWE